MLAWESGRSLGAAAPGRALSETSALERLSRRAARGDHQAFRQWVEKTHTRVYRLAYRQLGSSTEAEDVVQETYIRAWNTLGTLRDHRAGLAWLYRITRNAATDRVRKRTRYPMGRDKDAADEAGEAALTSDAQDPEARAISRQQAEKVWAVVGRLKEKYRTVLLLRQVDGLSYEEISEALGIPVGTVESRLHRARKALHEKMRKANHEM